MNLKNRFIYIRNISRVDAELKADLKSKLKSDYSLLEFAEFKSSNSVLLEFHRKADLKAILEYIKSVLQEYEKVSVDRVLHINDKSGKLEISLSNMKLFLNHI